MKRWKSAGAVLLAFVMLLSGCGRADDGTRTGKAMGRYIEEEWTVPLEDVMGIVGPILLPDGRIQVLANSYDGSGQKSYITEDGKNWVEETPEWLAELVSQDCYINDLHYNAQGIAAVLVVGGEADDYGYYVDLLYPDGSLVRTPIGTIETESNSAVTHRARRSSPSDGEEEEEETPEAEQQEDLAGEDDGVEETAGQETDPEADDDEPQNPLEAALQAAAENPGGDLQIQLEDDESQNDGDEEDVWYNRNSFYASQVMLGDDGLVYTQSFASAECYDPETGERLYGIDQMAFGLALSGGQLVQMIYWINQSTNLELDENVLGFYDESGALDRMQSADMLTGYGQDTLYGEADGSVYLATPGGLYRLAPGGETWERVLDGALSSLSLPSVSIGNMVVRGDGEHKEFLMVLQNDQKPVLMNYSYSPDTPTRPDTELTVYTLYENATIKQAAGAFRKTNPNVLVNIEHLLEDKDSATVEDAIRALNTELLAGKGPDVLVLDGLPLDSYIEKGVLADLSDTIQPWIDNGQLLPGVAASLQSGDGAYYAVPARFSVPTLWGDEEAVAAASSLESLTDYASRNPGKKLMYDMHQTFVFYRFLAGCYNTWQDEAGQIDTAALARYLTEIKALMDTAEDTSQPEAREGIFGRSNISDEDSFIVEDLFAVASKEAELLITYSAGFQSLMQPNGAIFTREGNRIDVSGEGERNSTVADGRVTKVFRQVPGEQANVFLPSTILGINSAGKQQDLAKSFLLTVLGEETQTADLTDGFPVNRLAIQNCMAREDDIYMAYSTADEEGNYLTIEMGWPSPAMLQAVADILEQASVPVLYDDNLVEMIWDESEAFFQGGISAEDAAAAVAERARLMLAE